MRRSVSILLLAGALLVALGTAGGVRAEESLLLPGVARADGVGGSRFVSTAWLHNPSDSPLSVSLSLVATAGTEGNARLDLAPRETRRLEDPVGTLFALASGAGTLLATAERPFLLRGVTANVADPRGTYGLALTSLRQDDALRPGETGVAPWLSHGTAGGSGFRTNVALTLLEAGSEALVTLVDDAGLVRGEERVSAETPAFWQRSTTELAADPRIPLGRVEVRVLRGAVVAYAAVVDNVTGDGILALARRVEGPQGPPYTLLLGGAARTGGVNGTLWRTSLRLVNPGTAPVEATLEAVGGAARATRLVPPRGILEEEDVLGALGLPEGSAGAVRVTAPTRLAALAATRNVDPAGRPGTFAAAQEPIPAESIAQAGRSFSFTGLSADSGSSGLRTNVALVGGPSGGRARLRLRAPSGGRLAEATVDAGAGQWSQRPVGDWLGAAVPRDATLELEVLSGSLDAYASVVDNGTGDPVVLSPAFLPAASCPVTTAILSAFPARVTAGDSVTLSLAAPGRGPGRLVPGDVPLAPGGSVALVPATTTTWRWLPSDGCAGAEPVTVEVTAPTGAVMTETGAVSGVASGASTAWRGLPFAAPPTGALRFRPPAPTAAWSGVRSAVEFGPVCPQLDDDGKVTGSEDCLSLNVWAPSPPPAEPLPVLLFIHGGGNVQGASSVAFYDGTQFASKGRAVVVTVNYRLSTFGWLVQPFLSAESRRGVSGNTGTFDQLAALRWVKRNVAAFGGDPGRVTIFGESAGGVNVCALVASPLGRGLFSGGIMQSGGCIGKSQAEFQAFGDTITKAAGCSGASDPAACLRALPFDELLLAVPPKVSVVSSTGQIWGPTVDGFVLHDSPDLVLAGGDQNRVPFVIGANADETGSAAPPVPTEAEYKALLAVQFGGLAPLVLARYPASAYQSPRKAYVAVTTDARFVCLSRRFARAAATGGSPGVFRYLFSYPANRLHGAIHGIELPFVFGTFGAVPGVTPSPEALALGEAMSGSWARFAATGDPNGPGLASWPPYDPGRDATLVWDSPPSAVDGVRTAQCDFWDSIIDSTPR